MNLLKVNLFLTKFRTAIIFSGLALLLLIYPVYDLWSLRDTCPHSPCWMKLVLVTAGALCMFYVWYRFRIAVLPGGKCLFGCIFVSLILNLILNQELYQQTHQLPNALMLTSGILLLAYAFLRRYSFIILIPVLAILTLEVAAREYFGIELNASNLSQFFNATAEEVGTFLTLRNIIGIVIALISFAFTSYVVHKMMKNVNSLTLLSAGFCCLLIVYVGRYYLQPPYFNQHCGLWPVKQLLTLKSEASEGITENQKILDLVYSLPDAANHNSTCTTLNGDEGLIVILHIGESVRADHLSINGYKRNTTPNLAQIQNLINFHDCVSSSGLTTYATITMLTNGRRALNFTSAPNMLPSTLSFMDILNRHHVGIHCVLAHSTLIDGTGQNTLPKIFLRLTRCASSIQSCEGEPKEQLSLIDKLIHTKEHSNKFILINNTGSHIPFSNYDKHNPPFTPSSESAYGNSPALNREEGIKALNAYDNTIHYTDDYIHRVIQKLEDKPFVYIFIGDHGEYVGDDGCWSRVISHQKENYYRTRGCLVPFFIIYSDAFSKLHPHFAEAIRQLKSHSKIRTAHEHLFHTILGLYGVESPYYAPELDLCSPHVQPYTGPHPDDLPPINTDYETRVDSHQGI